jgi:glycosyltransferase involved in cell wall biosynthesis
VVYVQEILGRKKAMRVCVVIPTYNESSAIAGLIKDIRKLGLDVVVVDDGSQDNTPRLAEVAGAIVLRNKTNEGKGASLVKGFDYILTKGYDCIIAMDGDGQHLAQDIASFISAAENSPNEIFIGNRMLKTKKMPWTRVITNKFMSWLISHITCQDIPDTQCGFRLIKAEALKKLKLQAGKYETEAELLIKAARCGLKIESVGIETVYSGQKSRINPFTDTLRFIRFIVKEL